MPHHEALHIYDLLTESGLTREKMIELLTLAISQHKLGSTTQAAAVRDYLVADKEKDDLLHRLRKKI